MPQTTSKSLSSLPNQSKRPRTTTDLNASAIISIILQASYKTLRYFVPAQIGFVFSNWFFNPQINLGAK
jgi:hypothetical protein